MIHKEITGDNLCPGIDDTGADNSDVDDLLKTLNEMFILLIKQSFVDYKFLANVIEDLCKVTEKKGISLNTVKQNHFFFDNLLRIICSSEKKVISMSLKLIWNLCFCSNDICNFFVEKNLMELCFNYFVNNKVINKIFLRFLAIPYALCRSSESNFLEVSKYFTLDLLLSFVQQTFNVSDQNNNIIVAYNNICLLLIEYTKYVTNNTSEMTSKVLLITKKLLELEPKKILLYYCFTILWNVVSKKLIDIEGFLYDYHFDRYFENAFLNILNSDLSSINDHHTILKLMNIFNSLFENGWNGDKYPYEIIIRYLYFVYTNTEITCHRDNASDIDIVFLNVFECFVNFLQRSSFMTKSFISEMDEFHSITLGMLVDKDGSGNIIPMYNIDSKIRILVCKSIILILSDDDILYSFPKSQYYTLEDVIVCLILITDVPNEYLFANSIKCMHKLYNILQSKDLALTFIKTFEKYNGRQIIETSEFRPNSEVYYQACQFIDFIYC